MPGDEVFELSPGEDSLRGKVVGGDDIEPFSCGSELFDLPAYRAGYTGDLSEDVRSGALKLFFEGGGVAKVHLSGPGYYEYAGFPGVLTDDPAGQVPCGTFVRRILVVESSEAEEYAKQQEHEEGAEPGEQLPRGSSCLA